RERSMDFDAPRVDALHPFVPVWMRLRISSTRHAVMRGPSLTGFGNRPDLTPSHQQLFLTGMIGGTGCSAVGSPIICGKRWKTIPPERASQQVPKCSDVFSLFITFCA